MYGKLSVLSTKLDSGDLIQLQVLSWLLCAHMFRANVGAFIPLLGSNRIISRTMEDVGWAMDQAYKGPCCLRAVERILDYSILLLRLNIDR